MRMSRKFSPGWVGVGGFQAIYKFPGGSKAYFRKFYYVNLRNLNSHPSPPQIRACNQASGSSSSGNQQLTCLRNIASCSAAVTCTRGRGHNIL